jgi:precorrin-6A/cobalt-precorrin-6A reductase
MIMVLAGTKDGRILAERLFERGLPVLATTVTEYGSRLFQAGIYLRTGPFNKEDFRQVIYKNNIELIIDATHPYARDISEIAIAVSGECKVKYLRYERENTLQEYANIIHAKDLDEAIRILGNYQQIFLTTGSKSLDRFMKLIDRGKRLMVRVLPKSEILKKCEDIGLSPENIIAIKGPFSSEMNYQMFKEYKADVVVTKDSGIIGGVPEKIEAASRLKLPVVLIQRPHIDYPEVINDMEQLIREVCDK